MNELQAIEFKNQRVLTSSQLSESYETTDRRISENFNRNRERYIEGKHYFYLTDDELEGFLHYANYGGQNSSKIRSLYLWTEKGALLHAKSLNTDRAWELYEHLVDTYFKIREFNLYKNLSPETRAVVELDIKQQQLESKVHIIDNKIEDFKVSMPLFNVECDELQGAVKKKGIEVLGGYKTPAYNDKSLRGKVYADIHNQIRREFGLRSYKAIKRKDLTIAKKIITDYKIPLILRDEIILLNNQVELMEVKSL